MKSISDGFISLVLTVSSPHPRQMLFPLPLADVGHPLFINHGLELGFDCPGCVRPEQVSAPTYWLSAYGKELQSTPSKIKIKEIKLILSAEKREHGLGFI